MSVFVAWTFGLVTTAELIATPEPTVLLLVGAGLVGLGALARKRIFRRSRPS